MSSRGLAERVSFLAAAGEALASSLDVDQTLQEIARLAVPLLGDLCMVDLVDQSRLKRVATAHVVPEKAAMLDELRRRYPPSPDSPQPAGRVMQSGRFELLDRITPAIVADHTRDAAHAQLIRDIGIRSHLAVPLVARQVTVGVISLGISESDRVYGPEDLALAEDLARRAALAIDNARLYELARTELAERQRAEEALRVSEERFRAIFEQSPLSTQILSVDGTTVRVNGAWERLWGFTIEHLAGYNMLDDPQLEATGIAPLLRRAFAGEPVFLPTIRYDPTETVREPSRHDDPVRWVTAFAYPIKDAAGAVREVALVHEDVTEARRRQEALRASEERLRLALTGTRMNVWEWDLATNIVRCSENAREFWGIEIGTPEDFGSVIHPDDRPRVADEGRTAIEGSEPYFSEYRIVTGGRTKWVQSRGRVDRAADGQPVRMLGVTVDITDLHEAQERTKLLADAGATLGASLDYHATLQELARVVVPRIADWCAVDLLTEDGSLHRAAVYHPDHARVAVAQELFARYPPRRDPPQGPWKVIGTRQPEWVPEITDAMLEAGAENPEHLALLRGLKPRSFIAVPLIARDQPIGVFTLAFAESNRRYSEADVAFATDLAQRAAAAVDNAQLYQRLRAEDRRKDEFLATLAHELRNPLAPIRTGLALLRISESGAAAERTREIMERQLAQMVRLIDELLDLSRVTRGTIELDKQRTDLVSILTSAIEASRPVLDEAGVRLSVRLPDAPILIEVDRTRMSQVLSNILNNAAKFTAREGRVEVAATVDRSAVLISVTDTGAGIPREMLSQIFEMFVQVRHAPAGGQPGLGIGLTLVRRLVDSHGGRVWVESDGPGRGSTFYISLPLASASPPAESAAAANTATASSRARRVLVVDDNLDAAEMLVMLLSLEGHEVRMAGSGPEAIDIVQQFRPHVAFLDIGLPGMSGYELATRLRADPNLAGLALVAVTGWGQAEDRRRSKEAGFDEHLTKPVEPEAVLAVLARP